MRVPAGPRAGEGEGEGEGVRGRKRGRAGGEASGRSSRSNGSCAGATAARPPTRNPAGKKAKDSPALATVADHKKAKTQQTAATTSGIFCASAPMLASCSCRCLHPALVGVCVTSCSNARMCDFLVSAFFIDLTLARDCQEMHETPRFRV